LKIYRKKNILYLIGILFFISFIFIFAGKIIPGINNEDSAYEIESCGVERWAVKVFNDADASSINITPINTTIDSLVHMKTPFPDPNMARQPIEKQVYTIHCLLNQIKLESDGDYHLTVSDSQGNSMITEIPDPTCPSTTSSIYFGNLIQCRQFIDKNYTVTGSFQNVNKRVIISGVAFVDPPHGQTDAAPNNIELHSILNIEFEPVHSSDIAESKIGAMQISVFPNPFNTETEFNLDANGLLYHEGILKIFDLSGEEVRSIIWPMNAKRITLQRDDLPKGIYFYQLNESGNIVATGKIMAL